MRKHVEPSLENMQRTWLLNLELNDGFDGKPEKKAAHAWKQKMPTVMIEDL